MRIACDFGENLMVEGPTRSVLHQGPELNDHESRWHVLIMTKSVRPVQYCSQNPHHGAIAPLTIDPVKSV